MRLTHPSSMSVNVSQQTQERSLGSLWLPPCISYWPRSSLWLRPIRLRQLLLSQRRGFHLLLQARFASTRSRSTKKCTSRDKRPFRITVMQMDRNSFMTTSGLLRTRTPGIFFRTACSLVGRISRTDYSITRSPMTSSSTRNTPTEASSIQRGPTIFSYSGSRARALEHSRQRWGLCH